MSISDIKKRWRKSAMSTKSVGKYIRMSEILLISEHTQKSEISDEPEVV
jgi:hypothetical protein